MDKKLIHLFLLLFAFNLCIAQNSNLLVDAKAAFINEKYHDAIFLYELSEEEEDPSVHSLYYKGMAEYHTNLYIKAERSLKKAIKIDSSKIYPKAHYYLGQINKNLSSYGEAIEHFVSAEKELSTADPELAEKALEQITYCEWAMGAIASPEEGLKFEHLSGELSSQFALYSPRIIKDSLYFTSFETLEERKKSNTRRDLMKIERGKEDFASIVYSLDEENKHLAHLSINTKSNRLYYSICDYDEKERVNCKIYSRTINDANELGEPIPLPARINQENSSNSQPFVGFDKELNKEILYFVSNRDGGMGKTDIWYSIVESDSSYSEAVNLSELNTSEEEASPFYDSDNQRLFFSSKGHKNLGGYDIFFSLKKDQQWSEVVNPGMPLNSSVDDLSYFFHRKTNSIYFASNRSQATPFPGEEGLCCPDLFKADILPSDLKIEIMLCNEYAEEGEFSLKYNNDFNLGQEVINTAIDEGQLTFPGILPGSYYAEYILDGRVMDTINIEHKFGEKTNWLIDSRNEKFEINLDIADNNINKVIDIGNVSIFRDDKLVASKTLSESNQFQLFLEPGLYPCNVSFPDSSLFVGKRDTIFITGEEKECKLKKQIDIVNLPYILPIELFFDNNEPQPSSKGKKYSSEPYDITYRNYVDKIELFKKEYSKDAKNKMIEGIKKNQIEMFFTTEVNGNYESLNIFLDQLKLYLDSRLSDDFQLTLEISGYASPRSTPEYNKLLSARRIDSVKQYFTTYKNGLLEDYIGNKLILKTVPFGDEEANSKRYDSYRDNEGMTVFSPSASKDRLVKIKKLKISN